MTDTNANALREQGAHGTTQHSNHISNADFLRGLFPTLQPDEYGWQCTFAPSPNSRQANWTGEPFTDFAAVKDYPHGNGYFSTALLKNSTGKPRKRRKENFSRLPLIVVDDFTGNTDCTYRLQTSAGKCQVGWKLTEPITDVGIAERLSQKLAKMDLMPADKSGNNLVRYVRLPVQINTKYKPAFAGVLEHFAPDQIYTLKEVCEILGIDYLSIINTPSKATESRHNAPMVTADTRISDSELVRRLCAGEALHESLNIYIARQVSRGFDAQAIKSTIHGFMEANNDGTERYKARMAEIDRSLAGAVEKFAPVQKTTDAAEYVFPELTNPFSDWAVPAFPMDCVPEALSEFARNESAMSGFDAGGYAISTLVALSALINQCGRVSITDSYKQPPMLWFGLVSESGEGKSPVINAAMQFPKKVDKHLQHLSREAREQWETANAFADKKAEKPPAPAWKQLVVSDTTVEALALVLKDNPRGVLLHADELTRWIGQMDAYSGKGADKDRGNYLEAYDGGARMINRAVKGNTYVPNWSMSAIGGIQPEKLASMFNKAQATSSDGLYQRFIVYCLQPSGDLDVFASTNPFSVTNVQQIADTIFQWGESGLFTKNSLLLEVDAKLAFQHYANAMRKVQKYTPEARFSEHLGKYAGFAIRLTYALHVIECAAVGEWRDSANVETFNRAKKILNCLYHHSAAAYSKLSESVKSNHLLQAIATTILAKGWAIFTSVELTRYCKAWRDTDNRHEKDAAISKLIDMGWLLDVTDAPRLGAGRPAQGRFIVNPEVHKRFSDVATLAVEERASRFAALNAAGVSRRQSKEG